MAVVELNVKQNQPRLSFSELRRGQYVTDTSGRIFAVVFREGAAYDEETLHTFVAVDSPNDTYDYTRKSYRVLQPGESFTVTI